VQSGIQAVFFDLDGTLLDTGRDMANALNRVLEDMGRQPEPYERLRPVVSQGTVGLFRVSLGIVPDDPEYEHLRGRFLEHYERELCTHTTAFEGIDGVLERLERLGLPWGVVTNKPEYLAVPLLDALGLLGRSACVVGGDTLEKKKPDPEPLLHACALARGAPEHCVYVGDAAGDIFAGQRAGMKTLVAMFGYLSEDDRPETWGADGMIEHPCDILDWIE
jgi:phosphoglycolate phosphatase